MKPLRYLALATALGAYLTMVLGSYTTASGSGLGCGSYWPTCKGQVWPDLRDPAVAIEFAHRLSALATGFLALGTLAVAWMYHRGDGQIVFVATVAFVVITAQVLLGMVTVATALEPAAVTAHTAVAAAFLGITTLLAALAWRARPGVSRPTAMAGDGGPGAPRRSLLARLKDYFMVLKPGILFLLVFTGFATIVVASGRDTPLITLGLALLGGGLAAASAAALNNYLDRRLDSLMARTRRRPLPSGRIPPWQALVLGILLGLASVLILWRLVNPMSALLALAGLLFYAPVYTVWLKPRGPQNIVIGGAAGAFPALMGWAAVRGDIGIPALLIAAIVILWTPPHFWALALVYREDYSRAGIPMMPVVRGERSTKRQILLYSVLLVGISLAFYPLGVLGILYLAMALFLGALLLSLSWATLRDPGHTWARHLFSFSIVYLLILLFAMVADRLVL